MPNPNPHPVAAAPKVRPGHDLECCHPGCAAKPQVRYDFPIPLCARHIVKVLARASEVTADARQEFVTKNQESLPVPQRKSANFTHGPVVYYMRFGDRVKIGTTANLKKRLSQVPHDELMAVEPGGLAIERHRHRQFTEDRINGEWFTLTDSLASHISTLQKKARTIPG